jgi:CBS domain containing-hemolysin-like protein
MSVPLTIVVGLGLLALNGFFVAAEFAMVASRRDRLESLVDDGRRGAKVAVHAVSDLSVHLAGAQLGVTMASLGIGFVAEPVAAEGFADLFEAAGLSRAWGHPMGIAVGLGLVVFLHMVLGEMVPRSLALVGPEQTLVRLARPYQVYLRVVRPFVWALSAVANRGVRLLGREPRDELTTVHTPAELVMMLAESAEEGLIEPFAHELLTGVLDFGDDTAGDVLVPPEAIVHVSRHATVADVERIVIESGHSRLLVTDADNPNDTAGDLDRVLGFVHSKDLLTIPGVDHRRPLPLQVVRRILIVPCDRALDDLLRSMRTARVHLAVVVDEQRRTLGLVSLEDLLERLVGDILDESDRATQVPTEGAP